ncbi:hypothetical protein ACFQZ4_47960 [Catellatospora coxensis]
MTSGTSAPTPKDSSTIASGHRRRHTSVTVKPALSSSEAIGSAGRNRPSTAVSTMSAAMSR